MSVITPTSTTAFVEDSHLIELYGISELANAVSTTHHIQNTLNLKYRSSRPPPLARGGGGGGATTSTYRRNASKKLQPTVENDSSASSVAISASSAVASSQNNAMEGEEEEGETENGKAEEREEAEQREKLRVLRHDVAALTEALHRRVDDRRLTDSLLRVCHPDDDEIEEECLDHMVVCYDWLEAMRGWRRISPFARYAYVSPSVGGGKKKKKHLSSSTQQPPPPQPIVNKADCDIVMPYVLPLESDTSFPPKPKLRSARRTLLGVGRGDHGEDDTDGDSPDSNGEDGKLPQQPFPSPRESVGVPHYMRDTYLSRYHRLQREREREREKEYKEREEKLRMHYLKDDDGKWRGGTEKKTNKDGKDDHSQSSQSQQQQSQQQRKPDAIDGKDDAAAARRPPAPETKRPRQGLPVVEGKAKLAVQTYPLEGQRGKDEAKETKEEEDPLGNKKNNNNNNDDDKKREKRTTGKSIVKVLPGTIYSSSSPAGIMDVPKTSPKPLKGRNVEIGIAQPKDEVSTPSFPGGISKFVANNSKIQVRKERFSKGGSFTTTASEADKSNDEMTSMARKFLQQDDQLLWKVPDGDFGPSVVKPAIKHFIDKPDSIIDGEGGRVGGGGRSGDKSSGTNNGKRVARYPPTALSKSLLMGPSSLVLENLIPVLDREIEKDLELRKNGGGPLKKRVSFGPNCKDSNQLKFASSISQDSPHATGCDYNEKWSARESMDSNDSGIESCVTCLGTGEENNALKPLEKVTPSQRHRKDNNMATFRNNEFHHRTTPPGKITSSHSASSILNTAAKSSSSQDLHVHPQKISLFSQLPIATVYNFDAAGSSHETEAVISLAGTGCAQVKRDDVVPSFGRRGTNGAAQNQFSSVTCKEDMASSNAEELHPKDSSKRRKSIAFPLQTLTAHSGQQHHLHAASAPALKTGKKSILPAMGQLRKELAGQKSNVGKSDSRRTSHLPLTEGISGISFKESADKSHSAEFLPTISGKHLHAL